MKLLDLANRFIDNPQPIWENALTTALVQNKWHELSKFGIKSPDDYTTFKLREKQNERVLHLQNSNDEIIYMELPPANSLNNFYIEHGLDPLFPQLSELDSIAVKIRKAFEILELEEQVGFCVFQLVRAIQIVKTSDNEIDISYSNPQIPFSIFFSVCEDDSPISNLRVAESILHETMHLKLTLIEGISPLINRSTNLFFSPWRDELRPAQGILHGLFVFRTILDFISTIEPTFSSKELKEYINRRKDQIRYEILQLRNFEQCADLTPSGATLTKNLLSLN